MATEDQIREIEEELSKTKYNKATQKHFATLKARLALLKARAQTSKGPKGGGYVPKQTGDATVVLVGFPSVGKSTLLNALTGAESKIGEWDFTTLDVIPGMLEYNGAKILLLDIPGLIAGASGGKGRGKEALSVARVADLLLIVVEQPASSAPNQRWANEREQTASIEKQLDIIKSELYNAGFRLDRQRPDIRITKTNSGGIKILGPLDLKLSADVIQAAFKEFGIYNAEVVIRERVDLDDIIDSLARNLVYVPSLVVINKIDKTAAACSKAGEQNMLSISALKGKGLEQLKDAIWQRLGLMRIYLKAIGKKPDMQRPLVLKSDSTASDVCRKICRNWLGQFRYAKVWGSTKFGGQRVGLDYKLSDKDIVEIFLK